MEGVRGAHSPARERRPRHPAVLSPAPTTSGAAAAAAAAARGRRTASAAAAAAARGRVMAAPETAAAAPRPEAAAAPGLWRFGVDVSRVDVDATDNDGWSLTPDTVLAFQRLAQTACNGLTQTRQKCRVAKTQGACHGFSDATMWLRGRQQSAIAVDTLSEACHALLAAQQQPGGAEGDGSGDQHHQHAGAEHAAASEAAAASSAPHMTAAHPDARGWEMVDAMYTDPDFRASCLALTAFFRERTRETRLAYVCGYRNALSDLLTWAASQARDPALVAIVRTQALMSHCREEIFKLCTRKRRLHPVQEEDGPSMEAADSVPLAAAGVAAAAAGCGGRAGAAASRRPLSLSLSGFGMGQGVEAPVAVAGHPHSHAAHAAPVAGAVSAVDPLGGVGLPGFGMAGGAPDDDVSRALSHWNWVCGRKRDFASMDTDSSRDFKRGRRRYE